jgi:asparagine synthase (glutamine-hydrolysing)
LSIIDPTETGHQPMADQEGRYWITYNGEIYNYLELRDELREFGFRFQGRSDTEVLLAAFRQWGEKCLERLRGMFAFGIWDERTGCLFAARDRLGIKPFHYWIDGNKQLAFASELKALLEFLPQRCANLQLATDFLAWNLLDHEAADTMVATIKRLPPAHAMTWRNGGGIQLWRYWQFSINEKLEATSEQRPKMIAEFRTRFEETVSLHLRSDVPIGTCLSGGLDSSAIACMVNAELRRRGEWKDHSQHTFSACFDDPRLDERRYIEAVATATGSKTHFVFPSGERMLEDMDKWLWHQEEPVGGSSAYAQYSVARLAREQGIKVLLDGQGADEQLAGYRKFILVYLKQLIRSRRYALAVREAIAFFGSPEILRTCRLAEGRRYLFSSVPEFDQLRFGKSPIDRPEMLGIGNLLGRRLEADLTRFSLPVLLRYEDRNTMAFGIESRVPFVDHVLVEWLATLPANMRLSNGWTKRILRDALAGILPELIRMRKSKIGFETPETSWLEGPLSDWLRDTLSKPRHIADVVDVGGVHRLLTLRDKGDRFLPRENLLFRLAIYEAWARQFLGPVFQNSTQ